MLLSALGFGSSGQGAYGRREKPAVRRRDGVALGEETFVPDSVIRDTRRGSWIATYPARAFLARRPPVAAPRCVAVTPILTLLCISISVTVAFWDLFR